jgi:hypothetical protein
MKNFKEFYFAKWRMSSLGFWTQKKMEINSFTTKPHHFLLLYSNVHYIYITWFKTLHKNHFWYLISYWYFVQMTRFKVFSMYTTTFFFLKTFQQNWKEKYLNFVIEYHFNDHSLENFNSSTWFINGKTSWII